jgi:hypothetical protein
MIEQITAKLKEIEASLEVYFAFINDKDHLPKDRSVVSFKFMNEMIAFETLRALVPGYVAKQQTGIIMAQGLGGVVGYVSIVDGKVVISPEYDRMLATKEAYMKKLVEDKAKDEPKQL